MLRTSGLLSVCCGCPAEAGLHRCRRHPMEVETLVSPNATRSQQCTQMPQTNVERPFSPICVHSYCVFPCGRAPGRDLRALEQPPAAWRGVARAHLPSWATFHSAPQAGGGGCAPRLPGNDVTERRSLRCFGSIRTEQKGLRSSYETLHSEGRARREAQPGRLGPGPTGPRRTGSYPPR